MRTHEAAAMQAELRAICHARVRKSFARAHQCMTFARIAHLEGNRAELVKWLWCARALRIAAARWRAKARRMAPILLCLLCCLGCEKAPPRAFTVTFDVRPSPDGTSVLWSLRFTQDEFNAMVASTPDRTDLGGINATVHAKVHDLIVAGFNSNQLTGCVPHERAIMRLKDGTVSFIGSCPVSAAHATPAGGI